MGKEKAKGETEKLKEELLNLINKINDKEGLQLLIKQSAVIIHNREVDRLNETLKKTGAKSAKTEAKSGSNLNPEALEIEEQDGFFIIVVNGQRVFFNRGEMKAITRICWAADNPAEAGKRLYRWFKTERNDMLQDGMIGSPNHAALKTLYRLIRSRYKVKD
jgi:hypothetical protein